MSTTELATLLEKFVKDSITPDEVQQLRKLLKDPQQRVYVEDWIEQLLKREESTDYSDFPVQDMFLEVMEKRRSQDQTTIELTPETGVRRVRFHRRSWFRYAASILIILTAGSYLWFNSNKEPKSSHTNTSFAEDVKPGKAGAILTLANGSHLTLDSLGNGFVAAENGARVVLNNGQLTYDVTGKSDDKVSYNTMSTPKGRQFQLALPDGTLVWLNAASSITYPTVFNGNERRVKISGELYFEVASKSRQPFFVETDNQKIEVLGTTFNINSYANEKTVETTLLTGALKLTSLLTGKQGSVKKDKNESQILNPGQTAVLNKLNDQQGSSFTITATKNPDKITAWKNGLFNFDNVDLYSAMRQLERWYNIEVQYTGSPENITFKGKIHRNTNLSNVLKLLEMMGIKFELKDNILYVK